MYKNMTAVYKELGTNPEAIEDMFNALATRKCRIKHKKPDGYEQALVEINNDMKILKKAYNLAKTTFKK